MLKTIARYLIVSTTEEHELNTDSLVYIYIIAPSDKIYDIRYSMKIRMHVVLLLLDIKQQTTATIAIDSSLPTVSLITIRLLSVP